MSSKMSSFFEVLFFRGPGLWRRLGSSSDLLGGPRGQSLYLAPIMGDFPGGKSSLAGGAGLSSLGLRPRPPAAENFLLENFQF